MPPGILHVSAHFFVNEALTKKPFLSCGNRSGLFVGVMIPHGSNEGCDQRVSLMLEYSHAVSLN